MEPIYIILLCVVAFVGGVARTQQPTHPQAPHDQRPLRSGGSKS